MNFIKRKVFLTKDLKPFDTNGDGVFNALVLSATTKSIQVPLTHSYDDMGVFETSNDESFEIIDINSVFNDTITGITQPNGPSTGSTTVNWGNGTSELGGGIVEGPDGIAYCGDETAINFVTLTQSPNLNSVGGTITLGTTPYGIEYGSNDFNIDNSLCSYTSDTTDTSGETNETDVGFGLQTLYNNCGNGQDGPNNSCGGDPCVGGWVGSSSPYALDVSSWSDYESTAEVLATAHCRQLYGNNTATFLDSATDFIYNGQVIPSNGDCYGGNGGNAFPGVKNKPVPDLNGNPSTAEGWGPYTCPSPCGGEDQPDCWEKKTYRYAYCFFCKEA
jgi:hypothetical protein